MEEKVKLLFKKHYFIKIGRDLNHQHFSTKPENSDILMVYFFPTPFSFPPYFSVVK